MAGEIRQKIDLDKLEKYIQQNVPEIETPVEVKQFGYGQSNPTYLLTSPSPSQTKYVLRKQPPGRLLSTTAHRVDREHRIIAALAATDVPVPRALHLCTDPAVLETPFYIMSFLQGRIFENPAIPDVPANERREMWKSAVTTLGKFHRLQPKELGMGDFGREGNFYNRQLRTFSALSRDQAQAKDADTGVPVGQIPHYESMVSFFSDPATQPKDRSTFVHGDYKIDNMVFHPSAPKVEGVLDWEMATLGHPLSDLVNLIMPFTFAEDEGAVAELARKAGRGNLAFLGGESHWEGLPSKGECVRWYEETVGWEVGREELAWAEAFGAFRGAIIMQGIAARYAQRQASSTRAREYGDALAPQAEMAWEFVKHIQKRPEQKDGSKAKL